MKKTTLFIAGFLTAINLTAFASTFTDEAKFSDWNREAIYQMQANNLMTGYEDGSFGVNNYVTRGELATILQRFENERLPELMGQTHDDETIEEVQPIVEASIDDDAILGDVNAPVTIVEFTDFQCPFCERFHTETLPAIKENYIDTGKVRLVLRDFPITAIHDNAENAALAAECLRDQTSDKSYWDFVEVLFANQTELDANSLKSYAGVFEINQETFDSCLDNKDFLNEVTHDFNEGKSYGVNGTPAFFIGQRMVMGAQDYSVFETAIEEALAQ